MGHNCEKKPHLFFNSHHGMWGDATIQAARTAIINAEQATRECKEITAALKQRLADMERRIAELEAKVL